MARELGRVDANVVRARVAQARERIAAACERAGRDPIAVKLLAATKYVPLAQMGTLAEAGIELVGENTAQDLATKYERWRDHFTFDFIGHLQSRKTKEVLPLVRLIHSVESESVVRQLDRHAREPVRALLQVNVAVEQSKFGIDPDHVDHFIEQASRYEGVSFVGLMTMPPLADRDEEVRSCFRALRELGERLARDWAPRHDFNVLSMGTSQDYEVAVEEGATIVRLGSALYGLSRSTSASQRWFT